MSSAGGDATVGNSVLQQRSATSNEEREAVVRSVVEIMMERQGDTVARMADEAVERFMTHQQGKINDQIEERIRSKEKTRQPVFTSEGNKDQFKHQKDVLENLEDVETALSRNDVEKAKELIDEGKKLVKKRMKLIKIADREDWDTVKEYVSDDLASDTDDEKDLSKAIKLAAAKKEKRKKLKSRQLETRKGAFRGRYFRPTSARSYSRGYSQGHNKPPTLCWSCGKSGHMQWQCYQKYDNTNKKM